DASRETLDHSVMYIFAVALEDGFWHHESSYSPERAHRPSTVALWHRVRTVEDPRWTRRYHSADGADSAFGGRVVVELEDGLRLEDELALADAHPGGARPFGRDDYVAKFVTLASELVPADEVRRFLASAERLGSLRHGELDELSLTVPGLETEQADGGIL
ncbi:MAG TPA: hypothetical protein VKT18_03470, partial [Acidimicrobiales bacterium]|nr:hypothetical protein [Acidimicrobiales bacterium]